MTDLLIWSHFGEILRNDEEKSRKKKLKKHNHLLYAIVLGGSFT